MKVTRLVQPGQLAEIKLCCESNAELCDSLQSCPERYCMWKICDLQSTSRKILVD
jgi:hypothetical protein